MADAVKHPILLVDDEPEILSVLSDVEAAAHSNLG